jgi:acetolactate synthase-1/2/3 large subunit
LAYPERQAVAVMGDGGYLFSIYSLATAVQHRINVVTIVFDNSGYGTLRRSQSRDFGRVIGADLHNPDFVMLAKAHGAAGTRAENPDQIYCALMAAWERDVPTVIEVPIPKSLD